MVAENPHLFQFKSKHMLPGEEMIFFCPAHRDKQGFDGVAVLTDKRVAFIRKGMMSTKFEPWPLEKISSVESKRGIMFFEFKLHTSGDAMDLRTADKDRGQRWVDALQEQLSTKAVPGAISQASPTATDPLERLEKLAKLKETGVVSAEEYARLRQQIIDSM